MLFASPEFSFTDHWFQKILLQITSLEFENLRVEDNCIPRTSGEGVEETLIVQFGQKWMKSTTDALQDKKEEDEDPSQVLLLPAFQIDPDDALKKQQSEIDICKNS